jgi:hypothetical protein
MSIEVITKEDLQTFRLELINDLKALLLPKESVKKEWLRSSEVRKFLKISSGTLQTLRVNGTLHPSKIGGIMYYKMEEIEELLSAGKSDNV